MRYFQAEKPELGSNKIVYNYPANKLDAGIFLYMLDNFIQILAANRFVDVYWGDNEIYFVYHLFFLNKKLALCPV